MEKGLVSSEELEEFKVKNYSLQKEIDKLQNEMAKKNLSDETPKSGKKIIAKTSIRKYENMKDQGVQCIAERQPISPEKSIQGLKNAKAIKGMASAYEDYSSGYIAPLVLPTSY